MRHDRRSRDSSRQQAKARAAARRRLQVIRRMMERAAREQRTAGTWRGWLGRIVLWVRRALKKILDSLGL